MDQTDQLALLLYDFGFDWSRLSNDLKLSNCRCPASKKQLLIIFLTKGDSEKNKIILLQTLAFYNVLSSSCFHEKLSKSFVGSFNLSCRPIFEIAIASYFRQTRAQVSFNANQLKMSHSLLEKQFYGDQIATEIAK